ncbi:hypothetical protein ACS0TY_035523 [Phlomoides rotata]
MTSKDQGVKDPLFRDTWSFFFKNFHEDCDLETLRLRFNEVCRVADIFCPSKRDREGKRFGFVRFTRREVQDVDNLLDQLNNVWIGSYKLRVFLSKFARDNKDSAPSKPHAIVSNPGLRIPGRSYKEATLTKKTEEENRIIKNKNVMEKSFSFTTKEEERKWLDNCFLALLKKDFSWETHGEEIQSEWGNNLKISFVGDNAVLIHNLSNIPMKELPNEMDEWLSYWFEWHRPWKEKDVCHRRLVWTRWFGVPFHAWSTRFFNLASAFLGAFVKLDAASENKSRMDYARVLVSVPFPTEARQSFSVEIDGIPFRIKVEEEYPWIHDISNEDHKTKRADEESLWSDNSNGVPMIHQTDTSVHGRLTCDGAITDDGVSFPVANLDGANPEASEDEIINDIPSHVHGESKSLLEQRADHNACYYGVGDVQGINGGTNLNENVETGEFNKKHNFSVGLDKEKSANILENGPTLFSDEPNIILGDFETGPSRNNNQFELSSKNVPDQVPNHLVSDPNHSGLVEISKNVNLERKANLPEDRQNPPDCNKGISQPVESDQPRVINRADDRVRSKLVNTDKCLELKNQRRQSGSNRRKMGTVLKLDQINKKKAKFNGFVSDLASQSELEAAAKERGKARKKGKQKEMDSNLRYEALETWELGKSLGLCAYGSEK